MRKFLRISVILLLLLGFIPQSAFAAGHQAVLTWTNPTDYIAGETFSVYRLAGICPTAPTTGFTLLAAGITADTYTDTTVTVGQWCFFVTATQNGVSSSASNLGGGSAAPLPVATFSVTVT